MNLVAFSIRTKGFHNFARRLWTVFSRFGFSEKRTHRALYAIVGTLRKHSSAPTFFIPAVVLRRHPGLIAELSRGGTEVGIHGYVHNDYRFLTEEEQYRQTRQAISVFDGVQVPFYGFRNPYLGWNKDSLRVFVALKFAYESNEAVIHEVIDATALSPLIRSGYEKSLALFQAIPCNSYTLRPHLEGELVRIPTSIPDDEMLFDRLRITDPGEVGRIWSLVMQRVYDLNGIYTLNLHPERGILCQRALSILLAFAHDTLKSVWITRLQDVAHWWKARSQFSFRITPLADQMWHVEADCTSEATILGRRLSIEEQSPLVPETMWSGGEIHILAQQFTVRATHIPCIGLSLQSSQAVEDFLREQGYAYMRCQPEDREQFAHYLDLPQGLPGPRAEHLQEHASLVDELEHLSAPFLRFGLWPEGHHAALAITGDIDSVTIQDFFLRILEVRQR